jgi:hypothetical protein
MNTDPHNGIHMVDLYVNWEANRISSSAPREFMMRLQETKAHYLTSFSNSNCGQFGLMW